MSHLATGGGRGRGGGVTRVTLLGQQRGDGEKRGAGEYAPTFDIKRPTEKWIL